VLNYSDARSRPPHKKKRIETPIKTEKRITKRDIFVYKMPFDRFHLSVDGHYLFSFPQPARKFCARATGASNLVLVQHTGAHNGHLNV